MENRVINLLKEKLNDEIEKGCPYEQILKTSKEIDKLLVEHYLKETKDII